MAGERSYGILISKLENQKIRKLKRVYRKDGARRTKDGASRTGRQRNDEQKTNKRRTMNEQKTNNERTKDEQKTKNKW